MIVNKLKSYLIIGFAFIFSSIALVNFFSVGNATIDSMKFKFGLDLKGGSSTVLEIDHDDMMNLILTNYLHNIKSTLKSKKIKFTNIHVETRTRANKERSIENINHSIKFSVEKEDIMKARNILLGIDCTFDEDKGNFTVTLKKDVIVQYKKQCIAKSIEVINKRVNDLGTTEPNIYAVGKDRIQVEVPGLVNINQLRSVVGKTARLTFHIVNEIVYNADTYEVPFGKKLVSDDHYKYLIDIQPNMSGENLKSANVEYDQSHKPCISFEFDYNGSQQFANITSQNEGRQLAIVLDDEVLSAPTIQTAIMGGSGQISGNFTILEAKRLALMMRSGSLPVKLNCIEERMVGPSLGRDAVKAGAIATLIAILLIFLFMFLIYRKMSIFINIALLANLMMLLSFMSMFGITLTLSGIAAIAITLGMAVDANILINERIKDDVLAGFEFTKAVKNGYAKASKTIFDSNITTLIGAICLFIFGSGSVRGFAITFIVGILISMFTAILLSKELLGLYISKMTLNVSQKDGYSFDFIKKFRYFIVLSAIVFALTFYNLYKKNLNYGIDFQGGHVIEMSNAEDHSKTKLDISKIRSMLSKLNIGDFQVQGVNKNDIVIKTQYFEDKITLSKIKDEIQNEYPDITFEKLDSIGPKFSSEMIFNAFKALLLAIMAIFLYIWIRFKWQFSVCAISALVHDCVCILALFAILGVEFNEPAIVAFLITISYSINDTIVIFDRIRSNFKDMASKKQAEIINLSLNETLSRTILTSVTTLIALFALYIFGGLVIRTFSLPIIIGVIAGTYSSILLAPMLLNMFKIKR